ncbi:MAG: DUF5683 domain-containing protein [Sediminibacterium sp.]|nr:DUF5683 domain-containing protein [Sediminibacterium sp.]
MWRQTIKIFILIIMLFSSVNFLSSQQANIIIKDSNIHKQNLNDSNLTKSSKKQHAISTDSLKNKKINFSFKRSEHNPKAAIIYSAICPGLGQLYNRDYWKVPIVIGIVAIPTYLFFYNDKIYNDLQFAIQARQKFPDSSQFFQISPELNNIKTSDYLLALNRDNFRENRTTALFWMIITWGLNIAEAAVAGHLKEFNVSKNLSMRIDPYYKPDNFGAKLTLQFKYPQKLFSK